MNGLNISKYKDALVSLLIAIILITLVYISYAYISSKRNNVESNQKNVVALEMMVTFIKGDGELIRDGISQTISADTRVLINDTIATNNGARALLIFEDNSSILLNEHTRVIIDKAFFEDNVINTHVNQKEGQTWTRVKKISGTETHFELETPDAVASVRGTSFDSQLHGSDVYKFGVEDGNVDWKMKSTEKYFFNLTKGEGVSFDPDTIDEIVDGNLELKKKLWGDEYLNSTWVQWNHIASSLIDEHIKNKVGQKMFFMNDHKIMWDQIDKSINSTIDVQGASDIETPKTKEPKSTIYTPQILVADEIYSLESFEVKISNRSLENIEKYKLAIGTSKEARDVFGWIDIPADSKSYTFTNLKLDNYSQYYVNIQSVDKDGWRSFIASAIFKTNAEVTVQINISSPGKIWDGNSSIQGNLDVKNISADKLNVEVKIYNVNGDGGYWNGTTFNSVEELWFTASKNGNDWSYYSSNLATQVYRCSNVKIYIRVTDESGKNLSELVYDTMFDKNQGLNCR